MNELAAAVEQISRGLNEGTVIPYLGPGVLALSVDNAKVPAAAGVLVGYLTSKVSVPHKIRNNLTAAAQFIENFKHRKTVVHLMNEAFAIEAVPTELHRYLAALPKLPMAVDVWYAGAMAKALQGRAGWGRIQGLSQAEHFGTWTRGYLPDGAAVDAAEAEAWPTVLYEPIGSITPTKNFLVSDSDYVEVLTEIDIQTPIPETVKQRRAGRNFVFLGCRFSNQLERTFARQVMKRSSDTHWAVLPEEPTRNELRFMAEQRISRIDMPLDEFVAELTGKPVQARASADACA